MTNDSSLPLPTNEESLSDPPPERHSQVYLKSEGEKILLILPKSLQKEKEGANDWEQIWQQLKYCLKHTEKTWPPTTPIHLMTQDRLLDQRQLQAIAETLQEEQLQLKCIYTSRRQTAVVAAMAGYSVQQEIPNQSFLVDSSSSAPPLADPLYLKNPIRSGIEIRHPGTVIILGDVNPGGSVIADGDILVWGCLRGTAHAGAAGNYACQIMALRMEPSLLRIADLLARVPSNPPDDFIPEVAYVTPEGLRITQAHNFPKIYSFSENLQSWISNK
jgi:septum site-determining protein MinC